MRDWLSPTAARRSTRATCSRECIRYTLPAFLQRGGLSGKSAGFSSLLQREVIGPSGGTGIRDGFKIHCPLGVRVRLPPRAPFIRSRFPSFFLPPTRTHRICPQSAPRLGVLTPAGVRATVRASVDVYRACSVWRRRGSLFPLGFLSPSVHLPDLYFRVSIHSLG